MNDSRGSARWRGRLTAAWMILAVSTFGCAIVGIGGKEAGPSFNHAIHARNQLACNACHKYVPGEPVPSMPDKDFCLACHKDSPQEEQVETYFDHYTMVRETVRYADEVKFSHPVHEESIQNCSTCHGRVEDSTDSHDLSRMTMNDCIACHESLSLPDDCSTCHAEVSRDTVPPDHQHLWKLRHGEFARARSTRPYQNCALCHTEDTCIDCHAVEQPLSHTQFWRMRGHGLSVGLDRQTCAACHRSDFCIRCHSETEPLSHRMTPGFGSPRNTHCLTCHFPVQSETCSVCHLGTPSHAAAPPKPDWHTPAMDCRSCHLGSLGLTHEDGGQDCNLCHH